MRPILRSAGGAHDAAEAFEAELTRLEGEIKEANQRLDRLEAEALQALIDLSHERFEGYR